MTTLTGRRRHVRVGTGVLIAVYTVWGDDRARHHAGELRRPAREISILIGAAMGTRFLRDGDARRRIFAAAMMLAGVPALSVG